MKNYVKPELDIVEFQLNTDIVTDSLPDPWEDPFNGFGFDSSDEVFVGEEEGYVV